MSKLEAPRVELLLTTGRSCFCLIFLGYSSGGIPDVNDKSFVNVKNLDKVSIKRICFRSLIRASASVELNSCLLRRYSSVE